MMDTSLQEFNEIQHRFDEIITELPAHGSTLAKIKAAYERVMTKIEGFNRVRSLVQLEETQRNVRDQTLRNFALYQQELESQLNELKEENQKLYESLEKRKERQIQMRLKEERERVAALDREKMDYKRRKTLFLSAEQASNISFLDEELKRVERELEDIKITTDKRHVPLSKKTALQIQLQEKEKEKLKLEKENKYLGCLFVQLSVSLKAAQFVYSVLQSGSRHHCTMAEQVLDSINRIDDNEIRRVLEDMSEENRDEEKEAEFILYCTEKFHELFDSEQYEEAALLAATSPTGFLRTHDILNKFKAVSAPPDSSRSGLQQCAAVTTTTTTPLLHYCTAIMHSASLFKPLTLNEAMEFVKCALDCRQYDRLMNWIANGNLPISRDIALMTFRKCSCPSSDLCVCHCCEIALTMFERLGCHRETEMIPDVAACLVRLGMYGEVAALTSKYKQVQRNDILELLCTYPNEEFAMSLVCPSSRPHTPPCDILEVVFTLCQSKQYSVCQNVVEKYADHHSISVASIVDSASRNPANSELLQRLVDMTAGTDLHWMAIEVLASRTVQTAIDRVLNEIRESLKKSWLLIQHQDSLLSSTTQEEEGEGTSDDGTSEGGEDTPTIAVPSSRPRLVRSSRIDLGDADEEPSASPDSSSSGSSTAATSTNASTTTTTDDSSTTSSIDSV